MPALKEWCSSKDETVGGHHLHTLTALASKVSEGIEAVSSVIPSHYASEARVAALMRRLGKVKAASHIEEKLPKGKKIRSGDMVEILCAIYVTEVTPYKLGINRLRWKDHREMAMRGEDIIAFMIDTSTEKIDFLKGEAKSNATLTSTTVLKAREALLRDGGRPSAHALAFISDRLHEAGKNDLAELIDDALLNKGIQLSQVAHLMFVFSGNDPAPLLRKDLADYKGSISQYAVGLRVATHQDFIKAVYEKVISDGSKP